MKYKCIIFDCDGVLVDSEAISIGVLVELAKEAGLHLDYEQALEDFSGEALQYCLEQIEKQAPQALPENAIQLFRECTFQAFKDSIQAIPGIAALLQRLKEVPKCVASNAPQNKIELNLGLLDLLKHFEGRLFSAYELERWKPEPDLFLHAARQMGYTPKDCVVIEDSLAGVQAAVAGGFDVFAYTRPKRAKQLEAAGAHVFFDMNQLDDLLK